MGRTDGIHQQDALAATAQFPGCPGAKHAGADDDGIPPVRSAHGSAMEGAGSGESQGSGKQVAAG